MSNQQQYIPRGLRTLPDDVLSDGIWWRPTWEENRIAHHRQQIEKALADANRIALEEQREWMSRQTERLAAIALEIDAAERQQKVAEEMEKRENWWKQVSEQEKQQNQEILVHYQEQLDGGAYAKMVARAEKAKREMDRENAQLERLALLKRGVLQGTRRQPAAGRWRARTNLSGHVVYQGTLAITERYRKISLLASRKPFIERSSLLLRLLLGGASFPLRTISQVEGPRQISSVYL
jgi:hypothetical protein